uniref:Uncharacterized protein n=1 Tax=Naja naja TaxID=35670 RepID=A0A8C6Y3K3_NAJNA
MFIKSGVEAEKHVSFQNSIVLAAWLIFHQQHIYPVVYMWSKVLQQKKIVSLV